MCDEIEETRKLSLNFRKLDFVQGVLPVVVQDQESRAVLLLAYTNEEAFRRTVATRELTLWSTSRNRLWIKGAEESGNGYQVREIYVNCEQNSLLYLVTANSGTAGICHTKDKTGQCRESCYYRKLEFATGELII